MSTRIEKETELEKLHKATLRRKQFFASFHIGDRVEVTTGTRANKGQIYLTHPRFVTVVFDGHEYKTTLSLADYLTGRFRIKKLEEGDPMAQKLEAPSKGELEIKLMSHQGSINKLAKDYGVSWGKARDWLIEHGLIEVSRDLANIKRDKEDPEVVECNDKSNYLESREAAELVTPEEPCTAKSPGEVILAYQEEIEYSLCKITEKLNALERKVDLLQTAAQVEFKDVADLAERMARVWIDARR